MWSARLLMTHRRGPRSEIRLVRDRDAVVEEISSRSRRRVGPDRSVLRLIKMAQAGRLLTLLCRHQFALGAEHEVLALDAHMLGALGADSLHPDRIAVAHIILGHRPWPGKRIVEGRDLVVQDVRVGLVEEDALLDD